MEINQDQIQDQMHESADDEKTYVAFYLQNQKLGVACYDVFSNEVLVAEVFEDENFCSIEKSLFQLKPEKFILSTMLRNSKILLDKIMIPFYHAKQKPELALESEPKPEPEPNAQPDQLFENSPYKDENVVFLPPQFFSETVAKQYLVAVEIGSSVKQPPAQKLAYMQSFFNTQNSSVVRAFGALMSWLVKNQIIFMDQQTIHLSALRTLGLNDFVTMRPQDFFALNIFQTEMHPLLSGSLAGKEGVSLFGIVNHTRTTMGRRLLRSWFQRPSLDLEVIQSRHEMVETLKNIENSEIVKSISQALRDFKNVQGIISRILTHRESVNDWYNICLTSFSIIRVAEIFNSAPRIASKIKPFRKIVNECDLQNIKDMACCVEGIIDFKQSKLLSRICINPGISKEVDQLKTFYENLDSYLTKVGVQEIKRLEEDERLQIPCMHVSYYPQIGYLIVLEDHIVDEIQLKEHGFEFVFRNDNLFYFKNARMKILDDELGDIHGRILNLELQVVDLLKKEIEPVFDWIIKAASLIAEIDCLLSFVTASQKYNWIKPQMTAAFTYHIEGGRHPIQELTVPMFVENDTDASSNDIFFITGPNFSGKSVYIKQIALIVFLAHIGCCVPARRAEIGITDQILCRIQSFESVTIQQSYFYLDCSQVASMLNNATQRSLFLLDEFGKGTEECDGISILAAVLSEFSTNISGPIVLATSHHHEIITNSLVEDRDNRIKICSMDTVVKAQDESSPLSEEVVYLYKLLDGILAAESYAINCAKDAGIPLEILRRAVEVRNSMKKGEPLKMPRMSTDFEKAERCLDKLLLVDFDDSNDVESLIALIDDGKSTSFEQYA